MTNWWPLFTRDPVESLAHDDWTAVGPIVSSRTFGTSDIFSIRPLWTEFESRERDASSHHLLYPLFNHYAAGDASHWHLLNLVRRAQRDEGHYTSFDVFPFYFSRQTGDPETSHRALWPAIGTLRNFLGRERVDFVLWPLYVRSERRSEIRYSTPWPFIQYRTGPESQGWGVWPIYGHFERAGAYDRTWAAWPFFYNYKDGLNAEVPYERFGVLPFYARERAAGMRSETYGWPFFGYTHESDPRSIYREVRYFYPFVVQGRGEEKHVNRLLPFYAHERRPEYSKRWYLWPILKQEQYELPGLNRDVTRVLFFLYRDEKQTNPAHDFLARRSYLWPLLAYTNNGQGHRQLQAFDPLGTFFPRNEKIRENWTPLFAIYRFDRQPERTRHSVLWNFIAIENKSDNTGSVHIGPLFEQVETSDASHWNILKGLIGRKRIGEEKQWTFFWNSF